jgi:hypothetical protein
MMAMLFVALAGCVSQPSNASVGYVRTDGQPVNEPQARAMLAQCRGEGANSVADSVAGEGPVPWVAGMFSRSSKQTTITRACMARNGYLAQ